MFKLLYSLLIFFMVLFIGIDVAGYGATAWKLRNACSETLEIMKTENGLSTEGKEAFYRFLSAQGMDARDVVLWGTQPTVQRGEIVAISASVPYVLHSLRPLNQELSFVIRVEMTGLAQDFIR